MKKTIIAAALCSNLLMADSLSDILSGIGSLYDPLEQIDTVSGADVFGMCYAKSKSNFTIDVCGSLPKLSNIGLDACSALPNIPGYTKVSSNLNLSSLLSNSYCNDIAGAINSVIADVDVYASEDGGTAFPGGDTASEFYDGAVNQIVSKTSLVKDKFLKGDNKVVREILNYAKMKGVQDLTTIKADDLKAPAEYQDYLDQRETLSTLTISDVTANTPLAVSTALNSQLEGKDGTAAKSITEDYINSANETIDMNTPKRVGYEIDLQKRDTDFAIPTQETIDLYSEEVKPEKIAILKEQIKREAAIRAKVVLKDKIRKDIVALVAQKAVIMNEKFDRDAARQEIEELLQ